MMKTIRIVAGAIISIAITTACGSEPEKTMLELSIPNNAIQKEGGMLYFFAEGSRTPMDSVVIPASEPNAPDRVVTYQLPCDTIKRLKAVYEDMYIFLFTEPGILKGNLKTDFSVRGSKLNDDFAQFESDLQKEMEPLQLKAEMTKRNQNLTKAEKDAIFIDLDNKEESIASEMYGNAISEHLNDILGAVLLQESYALLSPEQFMDFINNSSETVKSYPNMNDLITISTNATNTSVGRDYIDITGTNPGNLDESRSLSQYVKPGNYTIIDFWASWCGPCRREIKVLKGIYDKYRNNKFQLVGVAVWDEPHNTLEAMKKLGIEWPVIFQASSRTNKMDHQYGVSAIPTLILIGPDGKILVRSHSSEKIQQILEEKLGK